MSITSPAEFLKVLDLGVFNRYRPLPDMNLEPINYVEPDVTATLVKSQAVPSASVETVDQELLPSKISDRITSRVVTLGDFIDTDAVSRSTGEYGMLQD